MIHNNPGNYPDPMPPIGEPCPAPQVMPTRKSADAMAAEILGLRARVAEQGAYISELERVVTLTQDAPEALMDTRAALGVCALKDEDFPALYALQGKRVKLVVIN